MILHARRKKLFFDFCTVSNCFFSSLLFDLLKKSYDTPGTQIDETFFRFSSDLFIYVSILFYLLKKNLMILQERHTPGMEHYIIHTILYSAPCTRGEVPEIALCSCLLSQHRVSHQLWDFL